MCVCVCVRVSVLVGRVPHKCRHLWCDCICQWSLQCKYPLDSSGGAHLTHQPGLPLLSSAPSSRVAGHASQDGHLHLPLCCLLVWLHKQDPHIQSLGPEMCPGNTVSSELSEKIVLTMMWLSVVSLGVCKDSKCSPCMAPIPAQTLGWELMLTSHLNLHKEPRQTLRWWWGWGSLTQRWVLARDTTVVVFQLL